jgi:hypothetical protein
MLLSKIILVFPLRSSDVDKLGANFEFMTIDKWHDRSYSGKIHPLIQNVRYQKTNQYLAELESCNRFWHKSILNSHLRLYSAKFPEQDDTQAEQIN